MNEIGYDRQERLYFVLDDNRLYRRTDPPIPPPLTKPKATSRKGRAAARSSKRRKTAEQQVVETDAEDTAADEIAPKESTEVNTFGDYKWECIAVTLNDYNEFLETIQKSKNADEKALHGRIIEDIMPVIEKLEEEQQKKIARRQKELLNMEKMATAKRSSRLADKHERERDQAEKEAAERKRQIDLSEARKLEEKQKKMEEARESRMMTREQRLKEREYKRLLHEEELANLSEDSKKLEKGEGRISERHLKAEMAKKKKELEELQDEDEWIFDCAKCGVYGENIVSNRDHKLGKLLLKDIRMTVPIALHVRSAMSGNIVLASVLHKRTQRRMISTLSVVTAFVRKRMQRSPSSLL